MRKVLPILIAALLLATTCFAVELDNDTNGAVDVARGGTNATTAAGARSSLGAGDVNGPTSSTDTAVPKFSGTGGKTIANSGVTIDASNNVSTPGSVSSTGGSNGDWGQEYTNNTTVRTCTAGVYSTFFEGGILKICANGTKYILTTQ